MSMVNLYTGTTQQVNVAKYLRCQNLYGTITFDTVNFYVHILLYSKKIWTGNFYTAA